MQNTTSLILSGSSLGTDRAFVAKRLDRQDVAQSVDALLTPDQLKHMKQKGIKRFVQCVSFALSGDVRDFDPVSGLVCAAIALAGNTEKVEFSQLHALCGAHAEGRNNDALQGVKKSRLNRFLGLGGTTGTITSKVSRSVGENGFLTALGIVTKSDKTSFTIDQTAKNASAFLIAYCAALSRMTDGAFDIVQQKQASK